MFGWGVRSRDREPEEQISFEFGLPGGSDSTPTWHPMIAVVLLFGSSAIFWLIFLLYVFESPI
jgi:hypothetical protein